MTVVPQSGGVYRMQRGVAISREAAAMNGITFMEESCVSTLSIV